MKMKWMVCVALLSMYCVGQEPNCNTDYFPSLPSLSRIQDALHGRISKENEQRWVLPFSLHVTVYPPDFVYIDVTVVKTNAYAEMPHLYVYTDPGRRQQHLWLSISPSSTTSSNWTYVLCLPLNVAKDAFIAVGYSMKDKDDIKNIPRPGSELRDSYVRVYDVRVESYLPEEVKHLKKDGDPDAKVDVGAI